MATFSRKQLQSRVPEYTSKEHELRVELETEIIKSEVLQYSNSGQFYSVTRMYCSKDPTLLQDVAKKLQTIFTDCEVKFIEAEGNKVECYNNSRDESSWIHYDDCSEGKLLQYINVYWGDEETEKKYKEEYEELQKKLKVVDNKLRELLKRYKKENSEELEKLIEEAEDEYFRVKELSNIAYDKSAKFQVKTD